MQQEQDLYEKSKGAHELPAKELRTRTHKNNDRRPLFRAPLTSATPPRAPRPGPTDRWRLASARRRRARRRATRRATRGRRCSGRCEGGRRSSPRSDRAGREVLWGGVGWFRGRFGDVNGDVFAMVWGFTCGFYHGELPGFAFFLRKICQKMSYRL